MTTSVRLYGHRLGHGSRTQVTRGFVATLAEAKLLAGVVALDEPPATSPVPGAGAAIGILTGNPAAAGCLLRATHRDRLVLIAPNSSWLPAELVRMISEIATGILAPSVWAFGVLDRYFPKKRLFTAPHGIDPAFVPELDRHAYLAGLYLKGDFRVLHVTSTLLERKGTRKLLEAWVRVRGRELPEGSLLTLVLPPDGVTTVEGWLGAPPHQHGIQLMVEPNLPPHRASALYQLHHLLCQPSRGEAFGICPLEARSVGLVVAATGCSGHSEHLGRGQPGVVVIETGPDRPIDDGPGALAPELDTEAIARALTATYRDWTELHGAALSAADGLRQAWQWPRAMSRLPDWLLGLGEPPCRNEP